jgi:hypothetical protein
MRLSAAQSVRPSRAADRLIVRLFTSACLSRADDPPPSPAQGEDDAQYFAGRLAEGAKPRFAVVLPQVRHLNHEAVEHRDGIVEIDPVLRDVDAVLGRVPFEHARRRIGAMYLQCQYERQGQASR